MSNDDAPPTTPAIPAPPASNPAQSDFLTGVREKVASGESVYGPIGSPRQVEKLSELDAKIALGRRLGEIAPAPEPWGEVRVARERLAQEFPGGDPSAPMAEGLAEHLAKQIEALGKLDAREQANRAQQVADDLANRSSPASMRYSMFNRESSSYPTGSQIVDALLKDAEPAVNALIDPAKRADTLKRLPLDRQLLELYAARGRNLANYRARKAQLGL